MNMHRPLTLFLVASAAMLPLAGSAQVLLSTTEFAVLGGTAISVGGPGPNRVINGNVGLSPGATSNITGFPPGIVSGITLGGSPAAIISTGGATGQARADLITAKNALYAMPIVPANILSNLDLGTMAPLGAGVYTFGGAAIQTGTVVLNANFQNGVAWVFNIATSLTTAVNSAVTFINLGTNGGSDNGLYWNAGTAINIGDNNTIAGNYLAGTSISFTGITNTLGNGGTRALALAGVSFAGPGTINPLGGPGGGDYDGGLVYNGLGQLVPIVTPVVPPVVPPVVTPPVVTPPVVPVVFTGNVLLSSTGIFTAGPSGVTLVPGTAYPTTTLTIDGISANGSAGASLTINTATVTLTGANTHTGGTIVNNGALIATTASLPANQAVVLNSSTLNFDQPANGTFGGVITGNGAVVKFGTGELTFTGANAYTGGTVVNAGVLIATTATLPATQGVVLNNNSTLVFNQGANATFNGTVNGGGTIQKKGTAVLTLANTTTSAVDVQAGSLIFSTGIGRTTISAGALLGGSGTVTGNLTNNGTLSPGNSPGTINVVGNYAQSSTGKLVVEIASATSFDKVAVTGSAAIAGTLQVDTLGGYNPIGQSFTFLTAPGGVTGTFTSLTGLVSNSAATGATVTYAPTSATVVFSQLPFAGFAVTPNQAAVGAAAQATPAQTVILDTLPLASQFPATLNAISPQGYQVWSDFAFANTTALADRLLREDRATPGHDEYYFDAGQRRGRSRADLDVGSSRYTSNSGLVGGNHALDGSSSVGAFFAFGKTTSGLGSAGSQTTVKDKTLGLTGEWTSGPMFVDAMASYGFNRYESTRPVTFPGTTAIATSSTRGHQWTAGVTAGEHIKAGMFTVSPFGGLLLSRWSANGFSENDAGIFNATVGSQHARSLRSQFGAEASVKLGIFQPHVRAAWLHEFSNDSRAINASFGSVNYAVATRRAPRDSALYSAGLDVYLAPRALLYADLTAQSGGTTRVLSEWRVGVSVTF
jgi:autotransporter-associated beta strand protein